MKNIYKSFALLCMGLAATACLEENFEDNKPHYDTTPGNEIVFSANGGIVSGNIKTRTEYGDTFDSDNNNVDDAIEVKWLTGDKIDIMCPQSPVKVATYRIEGADFTVDENGNKTHNHAATTLNRLGDAGLQWSSSEEYDFYAVYPSLKYADTSDEDFNGSFSLSEEGKLNGVIPVEQKYSALKRSTSDDEKYMYVASPDMRYAYMTASSTYNKESESDKAIQLQFESRVTAFEFEIKTGQIAVSGNQITIQSVSLLAPNETVLSGSFVYDFITKEYTPVSMSNRVIMSFPTDGGVPLRQNGDALKVTFFTLPTNFAAGSLKLQILFKMGDTQLSKTATISNSIEGGKMYSYKNVQLDDFNTIEPSSWWDLVDPNALLTQVSIPVASNVFATSSADNGKNQQQQLTIDQLWNIGVRGFEICTQSAVQGRTNSTDKDTMYDDDGTRVGYYTTSAENASDAKGRTLKACRVVAAESLVKNNENFHTAFNKLCGLLKTSASPNECLVVICTYMSVNDGYNPYNYVSNLFNYLTWYCTNNSHGITKNDFVKIDASTTAGDLRGRIAIVIRPGDDERWLSETGAMFNPYSSDYLGVDNPNSGLTALIPTKLSSEWWEKVMMVSDWGSASFDVWDRRYGSSYAREAAYIQSLPEGRVLTKSYIEDYLYSTTPTNTTVGSTNYSESDVEGNHPFPSTKFPDPTDFNFTHKISDKSNAYVQEWMRVIPATGIGPIAIVHDSDGILYQRDHRTMWAKWPGSIQEKKDAIVALFNKSVKTKGNKDANDLYINVLTGYYADWNVSQQGVYPFIKTVSSSNGSISPSGAGKGGNFIKLANELNEWTFNLLSRTPKTGTDGAPALEDEGPWGLVMMDHIGASTKSAELVNLILQNNFKFPLATGVYVPKEDTPATYNATYSNGGEAISFK